MLDPNTQNQFKYMGSSAIRLGVVGHCICMAGVSLNSKVYIFQNNTLANHSALERYKFRMKLNLVNVASIGGIIQSQHFDQSYIVFGSLVSELGKDCN